MISSCYRKHNGACTMMVLEHLLLQQASIVATAAGLAPASQGWPPSFRPGQASNSPRAETIVLPM